MDFHAVLKTLTYSDAFRAWKDKHPDAFLAHAFLMLDAPNQDAWQIGYYDAKPNAMTTFVVQGETIEVIPEQDVLRTETAITPLNPADVTIAPQNALEIAEAARKEHYAQEMPAKTFFIIQNSAQGALYNITFFTASFKTVNVKVSASDGKVLSHSLQSLAAFS